MGAKAGSAGVRLGIDYPEHGPVGGEADSIGRKAIDAYNLYDPSTPTTIYAESPADAVPHLRNLLGVSKDADISHMILNHNPNEVYSSSGQFAIRNEDHRDRYDLVGQIVQQQGIAQAFSAVVSKHSFDAVDSYAHGGEPGTRMLDKVVRDNQQPFKVSKESKLQPASQIAKATVGLAFEVAKESDREYLTIDVFASKEDPTKRVFEVRTNRYDVVANKFLERAPLSNEKDIKDLLLSPRN